MFWYTIFLSWKSDMMKKTARTVSSSTSSCNKNALSTAKNFAKEKLHFQKKEKRFLQFLAPQQSTPYNMFVDMKTTLIIIGVILVIQDGISKVYSNILKNLKEIKTHHSIWEWTISQCYGHWWKISPFAEINPTGRMFYEAAV